MAWASLNTYTAADKVRFDMFNSLANDDRNWGGPVNGGGYALSNVILDGTAKASAQTPWLQVVDAGGFRLHSLGNVGIGNTAISPGGLPDANTGNIQTIIGRITATATAGECHLVGNAASGTMGILGFANYALAGTEKRLGVIYGATDGANNSGAVVFQTMNAGTLADKVKITAAGKLQVSQALATAEIDAISGNVTMVVASLNNSTGYLGTFTNHDVVLYANSLERIRVTAAGFVGIGITPATKFHVEGGRIIHTDGAVTAEMFAISTGTVCLGSFSNHNLSLRTNDLDRITITTAGNVGIGTASPGSRLAVVGLPTSAAGLTSGDIWRDAAAGNVLKIVP